tara:strand:+ start:13278 stop:13733 length:456 start_codon:yes stop_codon:yes gene_type:complete
MNNFFKIIDDVQSTLIAEPFINKVTYGGIDDVDLKKITIFPLAHMIIESMDIQTRRIGINVSILLMDIIDFSKNTVSDDIRGNNNELDVLNNMLNIAARLQAMIARTDSLNKDYELEGSFSAEPFVERFENNLGGISIDFTINMKNDMTKC